MKKIEIFNPYNTNHLELINNIENIDIQRSLKHFIEVSKTKCEEDYNNDKRNKNEVEDIFLLIKNSKIENIINIYIAKDLKQAQIKFQKTNTNLKTNELLLILETIFKSNIEDIIILVDSNDTNTNNILKKINAEYLGLNDEGYVIYLKGKTKEIEKSGMRR